MASPSPCASSHARQCAQHPVKQSVMVKWLPVSSSQWVIESVSDRGRPREWNSSSQQLGICHSRSHYQEWIIKVGMGIRTWTNYQRGLTYGSVWSMWSVWSMNSTLFSCPHSPDTTYRGGLVIRSLPTPHCWKTLPLSTLRELWCNPWDM